MEEREDTIIIGWANRPGFHGYFHEIGFHALDNRHGKQKIKRSNKNRKRSYRGAKATYVAPSPHIRPAFDSLKNDFYKDVQKSLE